MFEEDQTIYQNFKLSFDIHLLKTPTSGTHSIIHYGNHQYSANPSVDFVSSSWNMIIKSSVCRNTSSSTSFIDGPSRVTTNWKTGEKHKVLIETSRSGNTNMMKVYLDGKLYGQYMTHLCRQIEKVPVYRSFYNSNIKSLEYLNSYFSSLDKFKNKTFLILVAHGKRAQM